MSVGEALYVVAIGAIGVGFIVNAVRIVFWLDYRRRRDAARSKEEK